ncbi:MAG TPA: ubiquinol-cytochrome c reductase iron-sulfur subunit [Candidatus Dormibacteraeota bacterium]|nr:ubiquinol-cytochrome c reductase iron-sulfur subunit [Candidatus Dormibacteraeota bacterium]
MADAATPRRVTRRTFIGWWMAAVLTAFAVTGLLPILVYFWPAPPKGQKKGPINVPLSTPLDQLQDGTATKILAPTSPNSAFVMADGGGDNAPGDLAFGAFIVKSGSNLEVFAQNCSHLGCSINFNQDAKTFDCPCHGSRFHLDGTVLHGPAQNPLSHLTWKQGDNPNTIQVDGIVLGF